MSTNNLDAPGIPDEAVLQRIANDLFKGSSSAAVAPPSLDSVILPTQTAASAVIPASGAVLPGEASIYSFLNEARPLFGLTGTPDVVLPQIPGETYGITQLQRAPDAEFLRVLNPLDPDPGKYVPPASQLESESLAASVSSIPFDVAAVRRDFPILNEPINGRRLVWLDNAATTHKPQSVIDRLSFFYEHENSNIHRAAHALAARATDAYEAAREKVRRFLRAPSAKDIIFVRGATEGINFIAQSWGRRYIQKDDEIVITWLEHHANIVPWQMLCSQTGAKLRVAPVDDRGQVILEEYEKLLNSHTKLVSFAHVSNALGTITPAKEMTEAAHRHGAKVVVDGAQAVSHMPVDVQLLDCDFYVFSGHKVFAPTGIGVVFGKADVLEHTPPWHGGGNMISDVTFEKTTYQPPPGRFEAGNGDTYGLDPSLSPLLTVFTTDNNSEKSINAQLTPDSSGATAATLYDNSQADATLNGAGNSEDPASAVTVSVGNHISLAEVTLPTEPVTATNASKTASIYAGTYNQSELNASTGAPLDGSYLLALGFGPASQLQGKTALGVPALFVKNPDSYNRPILLLRVYGGAYVPTAPFDNLVPVGTSAATAGALSPDGKLVAGNLSKYQTDQQR